MGRKPCCEKVGLKRGPWTAEEDGKLVSYISDNGLCCWRAIPKLAGLLRCGKSCRLRWTNYLRPDLKRGTFTEQEENLILDLHATLGNRWSRIAAQLPGRTDNEIKNYWNTRLKKRLRSQGLDPATHLPLDSSKQSEDDEHGTCKSDITLSDPSSSTKSTKPQPLVKVRQPKGPKPALQLKMCQSAEGLVLRKTSTKTPKSPTSVIPGIDKSDDDDSEQSSCSTGTTKSGTTRCSQDATEFNLARKLKSIPSYPEAELWKCIKPTATSSSSIAAMLSEWESYRTLSDSSLLSPCTLFPKLELIKPALDLPSEMILVDESTTLGEMFHDTKFTQSDDISLPWSMEGEMQVHDPAPESLFAPHTPTDFFVEPLQLQLPAPAPAPAPAPSQELQRLAAFLDLI